MPKRLPTLVLVATTLLLRPVPGDACDLSSLTLDSVVDLGGSYDVSVTLCIGGGLTGSVAGADDATGSIAFSFFKPGIALHLFTPSVLSDETGAVVEGTDLGPGSPPFSPDANLGYIDSGSPDGFTCITSTAVCGDVHADCKAYTFNLSDVPDTITVLAVEGNGNPVAGCFGNPDMTVAPGSTTTTTSTTSTTNTTSTSTTSTTLAPAACAPAPVAGCLASNKAKLQIDENKAGKEKLKIDLKKIAVLTTQGNFGDPVGGSTIVTACIYDDASALVQEYVVDQAGAVCGTKDCWKANGTKGYTYKDKDNAVFGISKIIVKSGDPDKGSVKFDGKNNSSKGQTSLPTGVAAAISGNVAPTVQVLTSDGICVEATTTNVGRDDGTRYKATN